MATLINLLPEQHQTKIKAKRNRALAIGLAATISGAIVASVVVLFVITQAQGFALKRIQEGIDTKQEQIQSTPNLQDMLTLQSNLNSVPDLYARRRYVSKFFEILQSVSPTEFSVATVNIEGEVLNVNAQASSYRLATKLVRAMESSSGTGPHFSDIVLSGVTGQGEVVSFTLTANMAPEVTNAN